MSIQDPVPNSINVTVTVVSCPQCDGNASDPNYMVSMAAITNVCMPGTVVNFVLVARPCTIVFTGLQAKPCGGVPQLSTPSLSPDGKILTVSDLDSFKECIKLTFAFADGKHGFSFDPQIENTPEHDGGTHVS